MEERILEYLDAAEQALATYGPMAVEGTLMWVRVDAASGLFRPLLFTILCVVLCLVWTKAWMKVRLDRMSFWKERGDTEVRETSKKERAREYSAEWKFLGVIPAVLPWSLPLLVSLSLMDLWRWVGIFVPELWLVHRAISALS